MLKPIVILIISLFSLDGFSVLKREPVEVILGMDHTIRLDFKVSKSKQVQIGNEGILSVVKIPQLNEITLKGLKPGSTNVTIRDTGGTRRIIYDVLVKATDQSKIVQALRAYLGQIEGLEIGIKEDSVYIDGYIVVPDDIGRVVTILDKYPDVVRLVELSPNTKRIIARKMQDEIQRSGMKDVTVRVINKRFWLEGVVKSKGEAGLAFKIASAYIPANIESLAKRSGETQQVEISEIQNYITINEKKRKAPVPKLIKIATQFVELSRDYQKVFGFKWEPTLGGSGGQIAFGKNTNGGVTTKSNGTLSGTISNLFPKLSSAKSAGFARVIQSGVLIIKEGASGQLSKTTKKPFAIGTGDFVKSEDAEAGFKLGVTPNVLPGEKVSLKINIGVNAVLGDPPETTSNQINTELIVKSKESAVVGGVVVNKQSTDYDRTPPGGKQEVEDGGSPLFSFLRSKNFFTTRSQFVVFVTPEIIESASSGTEEIKRKFRQRRR